jgi:hypothetical protein
VRVLRDNLVPKQVTLQYITEFGLRQGVNQSSD